VATIPSASRHQLLLTAVGHQPHRGVAEVGADELELLGRLADPGVECPIREKNQEEVPRRVDPELGSGEAGVPIPRLADERPEDARLLDPLDPHLGLVAVVHDVEDALRKVEFPLGYHAELFGEYAEREAAQQQLLFAGTFAVIAIFFLLVTSFGNLRLATLTFFTLPWALVGGLLAAYFSSGVLSLGSLVGLLTILGIATRNGIMMISHFQHLEEEEGEPFGPALILRGAKERIAPIMMTALTTGLALVPLVIAGNIPGQEIEYPMALVILGGLVSSTLLNLLVVPTLYLRFGKARQRPVRSSAVIPAGQPEQI